MNVTLPVFMKHAEKVTKTASASRPILNGVFYREDGSLAVTDSHRLYFVTDVHSQTEEVVQNPKTGERIDGNYPEVTKLIPEESYAKAVLTLNNIDYHVKAAKAIQQVATIPKVNGDSFEKKTNAMFVIKNDGGKHVSLSAYNSGGVAEYELGIADKIDEPIDMALNSEYLVQALEVFKSAGIYDVKLGFYGNLRPISLTGGNMTAILLPIRRIN